MAGPSRKVGETNGVDKGKETTQEKTPVRTSLGNTHPRFMEEARSKFNVGSVRISKLPVYIDTRVALLEPIRPHPLYDYALPALELPSEVQVKGSLMGKVEELTYCDHDLMDAKTFPWFHPNNYVIS